jgi:antitoxin HicB
MSSNLYVGSSFDDFLKEEELFEEINLIVVKLVLAWQIECAMKQKNLTKTETATQMHISDIQQEF